MKGAFSQKKWELFDGNLSGYDDYLKIGDKIVVQHPRTMDRKQQSSVATIVLVTTKKAEAEAAERKLEDQAKVSSVRLLFYASLFGNVNSSISSSEGIAPILDRAQFSITDSYLLGDCPGQVSGRIFSQQGTR